MMLCTCVRAYLGMRVLRLLRCYQQRIRKVCWRGGSGRLTHVTSISQANPHRSKRIDNYRSLGRMDYVVSLPCDQNGDSNDEKAKTEKIRRPESCRLFHFCGRNRG